MRKQYSLVLYKMTQLRILKQVYLALNADRSEGREYSNTLITSFW